MDQLIALFTNRILVTAGAAWAFAQISKTILYAIVNKQFRIDRLFGDGGMPSCHSATVSALATACAIHEGLNSPVFAVAAIFAIVVMHDAMGVRLETGRQAEFLNFILESMAKPNDATWKEWQDRRFKEFVGHTAFQVVIGSGLGITLALVLNLLIWP